MRRALYSLTLLAFTSISALAGNINSPGGTLPPPPPPLVDSLVSVVLALVQLFW